MIGPAEGGGLPHVAVLGAGAVGCWFGGMLARSGVPVTLIGRKGHVEAIRRDGGMRLVSAAFDERVAVGTSTEASAVSGAPLVLVAVKSYDTESGGRALAPHLAKDAVLVSLQNGVENAARLCSATGRAAFPAVVWVAASRAAPGVVRHAGRGDLVLGDLEPSALGAADRRRTLSGIAGLFGAAGVPCTVSEKIDNELWAKLAANCAFNAVSALARAPYARIGAAPGGRRLLSDVVAEVLAVGAASGVARGERTVLGSVLALADSMAEATSSMAQDLARGRRTEVDDLNGFVARRGEELGVPAPVNRALHTLVKLLEDETTPGISSKGE